MINTIYFKFFADFYPKVNALSFNNKHPDHVAAAYKRFYQNYDNDRGPTNAIVVFCKGEIIEQRIDWVNIKEKMKTLITIRDPIKKVLAFNTVLPPIVKDPVFRTQLYNYGHPLEQFLWALDNQSNNFSAIESIQLRAHALTFNHCFKEGINMSSLNHRTVITNTVVKFEFLSYLHFIDMDPDTFDDYVSKMMNNYSNQPSLTLENVDKLVPDSLYNDRDTCLAFKNIIANKLIAEGQQSKAKVVNVAFMSRLFPNRSDRWGTKPTDIDVQILGLVDSELYPQEYEISRHLL